MYVSITPIEHGTDTIKRTILFHVKVEIGAQHSYLGTNASLLLY